MLHKKDTNVHETLIALYFLMNQVPMQELDIKSLGGAQ